MKPQVGMDCTVDEWGELFPATIIAVTEVDGEVNSITVRHNEDGREAEFGSNGDGTYGIELFGVPYIGEAHSFKWEDNS